MSKHIRMSSLRISYPRLMLIALAVFASAVNTQAQANKALYQINCGGQALGVWAKDSFVQGGSLYNNMEQVDSSGVVNAPPLDVYRAQRYGNFTYTFPNLTPNKVYLIRLHFAEIYFGPTRIGARVFNVLVNQTIALDHFDILVAAGGRDKAVVKEIALPADASGTLSIAFQSLVTNATVNAIEIIEGKFAQTDLSKVAANPTPTSPSKANISQSPATTAPTQSTAQEENVRMNRITEIAWELQDRESNTASLVTEAARLCGFAIWTEYRKPIAPASGPPLHLVVTDAEIERFSTMFRNGDSVALADVIDAIDYRYKDLSGESVRGDLLDWLKNGDQSDDAAVRALATFLNDRNIFNAGKSSVTFDDPNLDLDPIQALFILRVITEEIAFPILHSRDRRAQWPSSRANATFGIELASFSPAGGSSGCGDEDKDWAEDAWAGGFTKIPSKVLHHGRALTYAERAEQANTLIAIIKFLSTYSWLQKEMHVEEPGQPLIRTKDRRIGDGPRTVVAKFWIEGGKLTDWLKENRCILALTLLDFDLPKSKPLSHIETSWRIDQPLLPSRHIIEPLDGQGNPDRVLTNEEGEAKLKYDGAPQPVALDPRRVAPYNRFVHFYVTPQIKRDELKQDLVDAFFGALGIREGGTGFLTPIFEELYRLKWKATAKMSLMVRDWHPAKPPQVTGGMTMFLTAQAHNFGPGYSYRINWDRTLDFKDVTMTQFGGDLSATDPATLARLPSEFRQQISSGLQSQGRKITFVGLGPGTLTMSVNDNSSQHGAADECGDIAESEKIVSVVGGPRDFTFGPLMPPGMIMFSVEIDLDRKIAVVKGDFELPVQITTVATAEGKTTRTNKDGTRTFFKLLAPQAPWSPTGITVPLKQRSLENEVGAVDETGYAYSGSVSIPFTFSNGRYRGTAYLTFYLKELTESQP